MSVGGDFLMDYVIKEYKSALIAYIILGGLIAAFAPWMHGPFLLDWFLTVLGASIFFWLWVFLRATFLSITKKNKD